MNREAIKFTDLDAFFNVMEGFGYNGEVKKLIYEQDKLPYGSAYLVPTQSLPETFDLDAIGLFGGSLTCVQDINYIGTERFATDFMIYPLSMVGYVEVETPTRSTFAPSKSEHDWTEGEMVYLINIQDGTGHEFYLTTNGTMASLSAKDDQKPQEFKTYKQVNKQLEALRPKYPKTCRVYFVERREFEEKRKALLEDNTSSEK